MFRTNPVIFRTYLVLFSANQVIVRSNPVIFRTSQVIFRTNPVIFRTKPAILYWRFCGCGCLHKWQVTHDMWHMTGDTWQQTGDRWYVTQDRGGFFLQLVYLRYVIDVTNCIHRAPVFQQPFTKKCWAGMLLVTAYGGWNGQCV